LQEKIKQIELIREEPKFYLQNYFVDLKSKINDSAEKVKRRIDENHAELLKKLHIYEDECTKEFKVPNDIDRQVFDDLKNQVESNLAKWSSTKIIDNATENEVKNFNEIADSNLFGLKSDIFSDHEYFFIPADIERINLGKLAKEDIASKKQSRRNSLSGNNTLLTDKLTKKIIRLRLSSTSTNYDES
jgi:hypothetical protein